MQHSLHFHAFTTCQETARPHEDVLPTILSGNKGTMGPLLDRNTCGRRTGEAMSSCKQSIL